jgi:hypothetical protein
MADVRNSNRQKRLSAALRENLKRRKQQARGRTGQVAAGDEDARGEAAPGTGDGTRPPATDEGKPRR